MTSGVDKTFKAQQVAEVLKTVVESQAQPAGKSGGRLYVCIKNNQLQAADQASIEKEGLKKLPLNSIAIIARVSVNNAIAAKGGFGTKDIREVVHSIKILYSKQTQDVAHQHQQEWQAIHELMNSDKESDKEAGETKAKELIGKMHEDALQFQLYDETLSEIEKQQKAFDDENMQLLKKPTETFVAELPKIIKKVASPLEVAKANKSLSDSISGEYAKYLAAKEKPKVLNTFEVDITRDLTFKGLAPRGEEDSDHVQLERATNVIKTAVEDDPEWEIPLQCALTQGVGNCVFGAVIGQGQQFLAEERMKPGGLPNHLNLSLSYENGKLPPIAFTVNRDAAGKISSVDFEFQGKLNLATRNSQYVPAKDVVEGSLTFRMELKETQLPVYDDKGNSVRELFDKDRKPVEIRNDQVFYKGTNNPVPIDKQVTKMQTVRGPVISKIDNRLTKG